jgi:hypothetical protein
MYFLKLLTLCYKLSFVLKKKQHLKLVLNLSVLKYAIINTGLTKFLNSHDLDF